MFRKEEATASRDKNVLSDFDRDGYIPDVDFGTDFYTNHDSPPLDSALIRFGEDLQEWSDDATDSDNDDMVGGRKEVQTKGPTTDETALCAVSEEESEDNQLETCDCAICNRRRFKDVFPQLEKIAIEENKTRDGGKVDDMGYWRDTLKGCSTNLAGTEESKVNLKAGALLPLMERTRYLEYCNGLRPRNFLAPIRKMDEAEIERFTQKQEGLFMFGEDRRMRKWQKKVDGAWNVYMKGKNLFESIQSNPDSDSKASTYEQASTYFSNALDIDCSWSGSHTRHCYFLRARCTFEAKNTNFAENALADYERCITVDRFNAHVYLNAARLSRSLDKLDLAFRYVTKAYQIGPHLFTNERVGDLDKPPRFCHPVGFQDPTDLDAYIHDALRDEQAMREPFPISNESLSCIDIAESCRVGRYPSYIQNELKEAEMGANMQMLNHFLSLSWYHDIQKNNKVMELLTAGISLSQDAKELYSVHPASAIIGFEEAISRLSEAITLRPTQDLGCSCFFHRGAAALHKTVTVMFIQDLGMPTLEVAMAYESVLAEAPSLDSRDNGSFAKDQDQKCFDDRPPMTEAAKSNLHLLKSAIADCSESLRDPTLKAECKDERMCHLKLSEALASFIEIDFDVCFERLAEARGLSREEDVNVLINRIDADRADLDTRLKVVKREREVKMLRDREVAQAVLQAELAKKEGERLAAERKERHLQAQEKKKKKAEARREKELLEKEKQESLRKEQEADEAEKRQKAKEEKEKEKKRRAEEREKKKAEAAVEKERLKEQKVKEKLEKEAVEARERAEEEARRTKWQQEMQDVTERVAEKRAVCDDTSPNAEAEAVPEPPIESTKEFTDTEEMFPDFHALEDSAPQAQGGGAKNEGALLRGISTLGAIKDSVAPSAGPKETNGNKSMSDSEVPATQRGEMERMAAMTKKTETLFEVPPHRVGAIIGKNGTHINLISRITGLALQDCHPVKTPEKKTSTGKDAKARIHTMRVYANEYQTRQVKVLVWTLVDKDSLRRVTPPGRQPYADFTEFLKDTAAVTALMEKHVDNPEVLRKTALRNLAGVGATISDQELPKLRLPTQSDSLLSKSSRSREDSLASLNELNKAQWEACIICNEEFDSVRYLYAFGSCNHVMCSICMLKERTLKKTTNCCVCRSEIPDVVVTSTPGLTYANFSRKTLKNAKKDSSGGLTDIVYKYSMFFPRDYYEGVVKKLVAHICHLCQRTDFSTFEALDEHYRMGHRPTILRRCYICNEHKFTLPYCQEVYNEKEYRNHMDGSPDLDLADHGPHTSHPKCGYCSDCYFYDMEGLVHHINLEHYRCDFCTNSDGSGLITYLPTREEWIAHNRAKHFVCEHPQCLCNQIMFASLREFQTHNQVTHGGILGQAEGGPGQADVLWPLAASNNANGANIRQPATTRYTMAPIPMALPPLESLYTETPTIIPAPAAVPAPAPASPPRADPKTDAPTTPPGADSTAEGSPSLRRASTPPVGESQLDMPLDTTSSIDVLSSLSSTLGGLVPSTETTSLRRDFLQELGSPSFSASSAEPSQDQQGLMPLLDNVEGASGAHESITNSLRSSVSGTQGGSVLVSSVGERQGEDLRRKYSTLVEDILRTLKNLPVGEVAGAQFSAAFREETGKPLCLPLTGDKKIQIRGLMAGHPNFGYHSNKGHVTWFYKHTAVKPQQVSPPSNAITAQVTPVTDSSPVETANMVALRKECKENPGKYSEAQLEAVIHGREPPIGGNAIEDDLLPTAAFPTVEWLSSHDMRMYRWEGDATAWHSFALNITHTYVDVIKQAASVITKETNCLLDFKEDDLYGKKAIFVVLFRGRGIRDAIKVAEFDLALSMLSRVLKKAMGMEKSAPTHVTSEGSGRRRGPTSAPIAPLSNTTGAMPSSQWRLESTSTATDSQRKREESVDIQLDIQRPDADFLDPSTLCSIEQQSQCEVVKLNKAIKGRGPFKLRLRGRAEAVQQAQAMVRNALTAGTGGDD